MASLGRAVLGLEATFFAAGRYGCSFRALSGSSSAAPPALFAALYAGTTDLVVSDGPIVGFPCTSKLSAAADHLRALLLGSDRAPGLCTADLLPSSIAADAPLGARTLCYAISGGLVAGSIYQISKDDPSDANDKSGEATGEEEEKDLAKREGRIEEWINKLLEEIKSRSDHLSHREKKFDEHSSKKEASFAEERKSLDNGKRLLDDDRRNFHKERYTYKIPDGEKPDSHLAILLKRLQLLMGIPGKILGVKDTATEIGTVWIGFSLFLPFAWDERQDRQSFSGYSRFFFRR